MEIIIRKDGKEIFKKANVKIVAMSGVSDNVHDFSVLNISGASGAAAVLTHAGLIKLVTKMETREPQILYFNSVLQKMKNNPDDMTEEEVAAAFALGDALMLGGKE